MKFDADVCYAAHLARDARFDGVFFTGVKTTGIYCRPVCPARSPSRQSCEFFIAASAAESAGFRPCLRCRPELAPGTRGQSLADALLSRIQERAAEGVKLSELDDELGLSARQVRRILLAEFGVTPLQIAQTQRLLLAKQLLRETSQPISEIALAAGFRSLRNFNALFRERYALAPSACRSTASKDESTLCLKLTYRPPLAWQALMDYFRSRLVPGVEEIEGAEYRRTVAIDEAVGWVRVRPIDNEDALRVEVSPSLMRVLGSVQTRLRRMFDLDARPDAIHEQLAADPLLARVMREHQGLRVGGAWDTFELAVRAILGQQITVSAATTLSGRLAERVGLPITTPFEPLHRLAITPESIAALSVDNLCRLGLVSARAQCLRRLSEFALEGGLDFPPGMDHEHAVAKLVELPGIGPWTAHYIAMRALRFPDAFPAADLGLRKAIGAGTVVSTKEAEHRAEAWRPWRAYAAAAIWKSLTP